MPESTRRLSVHIGADVPPEMRAALQATAKQHGVSASDVLRWALAAYLPALRDGPSAPKRKAS